MSTVPAGVNSNTDDIARKIDRAVDVMRQRRFGALTGAGVPTASGIPDYRGTQRRHRAVITREQFLRDENKRKQWWRENIFDGEFLAAARPNTAHRVLAQAQKQGICSGVITQNVDDLHRRAGSVDVIEIHGNICTATCVQCGDSFDSPQVITALVDSGSADNFPDPRCPRCGGIIKPDIVFLDEEIPPECLDAAEHCVRDAQALLVIGTSLAVNSGMYLVDQARAQNLPVVIINQGATMADRKATVKIDGDAGDVLRAIVARLGVTLSDEPATIVR